METEQVITYDSIKKGVEVMGKWKEIDALAPEEIAAKSGIWFGWMSHTGVWSNPDHTIKGYEHLGPIPRGDKCPTK